MGHHHQQDLLAVAGDDVADTVVVAPQRNPRRNACEPSAVSEAAFSLPVKLSRCKKFVICYLPFALWNSDGLVADCCLLLPLPSENLSQCLSRHRLWLMECAEAGAAV